MGRAYPVLSPALIGAEVALDTEELPAVDAYTAVSFVNATVENACRACGGSSTAVCFEDVRALLRY